MEEQEGFLYTIYSPQYSSQMTSFPNSHTTINTLNSPVYNTIMSVEALPENILEDFTQWDEKKFLNDNSINSKFSTINPMSNESAGNGSALTNLVTMVSRNLSP